MPHKSHSALPQVSVNHACTSRCVSAVLHDTSDAAATLLLILEWMLLIDMSVFAVLKMRPIVFFNAGDPQADHQRHHGH